jgi:hypothetical protein
MVVQNIVDNTIYRVEFEIEGEIGDLLEIA